MQQSPVVWLMRDFEAHFQGSAGGYLMRDSISKMASDGGTTDQEMAAIIGALVRDGLLQMDEDGDFLRTKDFDIAMFELPLIELLSP